MNGFRRLIAGAVIAGGLLGLYGCNNQSNEKPEKKPTPTHFAGVPMHHQSGMGMTSGDFDGDGDLDLIVGARTHTEPYEGRLFLLKNNGNGTYSKPVLFAGVPMHHQSGMGMTSGDFDGDGDLDLIVGARTHTEPYEGRLFLLKNNGNGTYSKPVLFAGVPMHHQSGMGMTSGDFDGDGDLDLIVGARTHTEPYEGRLYHFVNNGFGDFTVRD